MTIKKYKKASKNAIYLSINICCKNTTCSKNIDIKAFSIFFQLLQCYFSTIHMNNNK